jgi:general secretion pathway protein N
MPRLKSKFFPKLRYVVIGLSLYLVFLVITFPANVAYGYWKEYAGKREPVTLTGLSGSIWSGKASTSRIGSQVFDSLQWQFRPLSLLLGELEVLWEFRVADGYGKGVAGMNVLGNVTLNHVEGLLPVMHIAKLVRMDALKPGGSLGVDLDSVTIKDKIPTNITGNVTWHSAEVTLLKPMSLGNLQVKFEPADTQGIKGVLSDGGGPLQLDGLLTLNPDGQYDVNLALGLRDQQQTDLGNALRSLGRPDRDGKYKIKRSGKLSNLRF